MESKSPSFKQSQEVTIENNTETKVLEEFENTVKYLNEKGWSQKKCSECGKLFFNKSATESKDTICCQKYNNESPYPFLSYPKMKRPLSPDGVGLKMSEFFAGIGYPTAKPMNIVNEEGRTDLIVAGVQMFDGVIHKNKPIEDVKVFSVQPSVRMQYLSKGNSNNGILTSFNNMVTEVLNSNIELHLKAIDDWLAAFSALGFHMNDFTLTLEITDNDWATGNFKAVKVVYIYGGLQLGDTCLLHIPQKDREPVNITDSGFGLERISWASNRSGNYLDALLPVTVDGELEKFDCYRTAILLSLCGVTASAKGAGLQLRRLAKVLSEKYYNYESVYLLDYFYDYWAKFITPKVSKDDAIKEVSLEIDRLINIKIYESLKASQPKQGESTRDYTSRLLKLNEVNIDELKKVISSLRKLK
jgi:hypothetical protein